MAKRKKQQGGNQQGKSGGRRNALREKAAQQRRRQNRVIGGIAGAALLLIGVVVYLQVRDRLPAFGEQVLTSQGNSHIDFGTVSPITYNSTPPTSGPHYGNIMAWRIYDEPQRYEHLVHNLEDGGVVIWYQCPEGCPEILAELRDIVQPYLDRGEHVVLAPNEPTWSIDGGAPLHKDMEATIAITAWQRILKMDEVDAEMIRAFIERFEGLDHHVPGIS